MKYLIIPLPHGSNELILLFLTAGFISPVAEELFFRGLIYRYLRRYGFVPALLLSTTIFASLHFENNTLPITQIIGGIVFALSFEYSKSIVTPIVIHMSGNITLLLLSMIIQNRAGIF